MAWYGKGPERVKSFSLYKELEGKYVETLKRLILQKEAGIAVLARELASLHAGPAQGDAKEDTPASTPQPDENLKELELGYGRKRSGLIKMK